MISNESLYGQSVREPTNRNNAYFSPGELANVGSGGLLAPDCRNTGNALPGPGLGTTSPCRVQPGVQLGPRDRSTSYFPRLTARPRCQVSRPVRGRLADLRPSRAPT